MATQSGFTSAERHSGREEGSGAPEAAVCDWSSVYPLVSNAQNRMMHLDALFASLLPGERHILRAGA